MNLGIGKTTIKAAVVTIGILAVINMAGKSISQVGDLKDFIWDN